MTDDETSTKLGEEEALTVLGDNVDETKLDEDKTTTDHGGETEDGSKGDQEEEGAKDDEDEAVTKLGELTEKSASKDKERLDGYFYLDFAGFHIFSFPLTPIIYSFLTSSNLRPDLK